jgi:regulatory protein
MKKTASSGPANKEEEYRVFLQRAAAHCSRKEQSSFQVREKLREWGAPGEWTEQILQTLQEQKYVDDRRFASLFVKDKFRLNKWGKVKIAHMLHQHGISEELTRLSLDEIDDEEYYNACRQLTRNKSVSLKERNPFTRKGKLFRYLSGRGFESDLIYRVLKDEEK